MTFLRRLLRGSSPEWASFLEPEAYAAFEAALHADLRARGWIFRQVDDGIYVDDPEGSEPWEYGLTNLAQVCGGADREAWPDIIRAHFDHMEALRTEPVEEPATWEAARPILKLRLFGPDHAALDGVVRYPVAPGIVAVLALDLPSTVNSLTREAIDGWPPVDELFAVALDNVRAEPVADTEIVGDSPVAITAVSGESFFVATRLLLLPEVVDLAGAGHALVAVPNRHTLLARPIRGPGTIPALSLMVQLAARLYRDGPGSIVPTVYWWHGGALTPIEARFDGKKVEVWPPDDLIGLLDALGPDPEA
jgi:hypothetical protein